jgi:hypothetical protein
MIEEPCTFSIEVRRADGTLAGACDASLSSCVEDAWFRGVQGGLLPNGGERPALRVRPTWLEAQRPMVAGLALALGDAPLRHYPRQVFWNEARSLIQRLVDDARIAEGEKVRWDVIAREGEAGSDRACGPPSRAPFPLEPAELPEAAPGSSTVSVDVGVLRRLRDRIRASGTLEDAELLVGRLLHDEKRDAVELRVVDALPLEVGRDGRSSTHFSFDPVALVAARRRASERADGALACGWHHNHNPCEGCWQHLECKVDWVFFSGDDLDVQAALFSSPHMVALVGGKRGELPATRPGFRLYGWRDGRVVERPFRVTGEDTEDWDPDQGTFLETGTIE